MIPVQERTSHTIREGGGEEEVMGVSTDANDNLFLILNLTNIYSNPGLALGREPLTNAWDSHLAAGQTRPVEITLPTTESPSYIVQDRGVGLSREGVQDTFTYSKSTKRNSETEVGMFGLGSKAPLASVPMFTVEAVKDGLKNSAIIKKNDEGRPVRRFLIEDLETDEPNGVKITIPIPQKDHEKFRTDMLDMLVYWRGPLLVDGKDVADAVRDHVSGVSNHHQRGYRPSRPLDLGKALTLDELVADGMDNSNPGPLKVDDDLYVLPWHRQNSKIVMGNVPYPVPTETNGRSSHSFIAWVPVGSVKMTPSRESLEESATTKQTIQAIADRIEEFKTDTIAKEVAKGDTVWEKAKNKAFMHDLLNTYFGTYSGYPDLIDDVDGWQVDMTYDSAYRSRIEAIGKNLLNTVGRDITAVVNFPFKGVSNNHVAQLKMLPNVGRNRNDVLLLRGDIEGMPSIDWSDVPELPKRMKEEIREQGAKKPRKPTLYNFTSAESLSFSVEKYEGDKRVLYAFDENKSWLWRTLFPDDVIASLRSDQENRFKRLHPGAKDITSIEPGAVKDLIRKLTKADKKWIAFNAARKMFSDAVSVQSDWKKIKNPAFREVAKVRPSEHFRKLREYATGVAEYYWQRLELSTDEEEILRNIGRTQIHSARFGDIFGHWSTPDSSIPLLQSVHIDSSVIDDAILYINAKYKENK